MAIERIDANGLRIRSASPTLRERFTTVKSDRPSPSKLFWMSTLMTTDLVTTQIGVNLAGGNVDRVEADPFMWLPMALSGGVFTPLVMGITGTKIAATDWIYSKAKRVAHEYPEQPHIVLSKVAEAFANATIGIYAFVNINNICESLASQGYLPHPFWEGALVNMSRFEENHIFDPIIQGILNVWDFFSPEKGAK